MAKLYLGNREITPAIFTPAVLTTKTITSNGIYNASDDNADGFSSVTVNISGMPAYYLEKKLDTNNRLVNTGVAHKIDFTNITDIGDCALAYAFYGGGSSISGTACENATSLTQISGVNACMNAFDGTGVTATGLTNLTTISGTSAATRMFRNCTALVSANLESLQTISALANNACGYMFSGCSSLESVSFNNLSSIAASTCMQYMFDRCTALHTINFPALTTTSFGTYTNQFSGLCNSTGTNVVTTLHFPSNLETTIQGLSGYPLFGGTNGYVVLAFDLPSTGA